MDYCDEYQPLLWIVPSSFIVFNGFLDENQPLLQSPLIGKLGGGSDGCRVIELIPRSRVCDKKLFWTETSAPFKLFVRQLDLILQQRNGLLLSLFTP